MTQLYSIRRGKVTDIWYIGEKNCTHCKDIIEEPVAVYISDWIKNNNHEHKLYHYKCLAKEVRHPLTIAQCRFTVILSEKKPNNSLPVFLQPPNLIASTGDKVINPFDMALKPTPKTKDNCRHSNMFGELDDSKGFNIGASVSDMELFDVNTINGLLGLSNYLDELKKDSDNTLLLKGLSNNLLEQKKGSKE